MTRAAYMNSRSAFDVGDLDTSFDGAPRMKDTILAAALGFVKALDIRPLIQRHATNLTRFGEVCTEVAKTSARGGRPGKAYYLNKKQALYICTKSETDNATEVTIQMVEVFDAYTAGQLVATDKPVHVREHDRRTSTKVDDAVRLKTNIDRLESITDRIAPAQPNFCAMVIDGEHVFVDINDYKVQPGDRAVVVDHAGTISINNVDPEYVGFKPMGPRSALGPRYPTSHGGIARNTVMIVGKVLGGSVRDDRQRVVDDVMDRLRIQITTLLDAGAYNDHQIARQLCCNPKLVREVRRVQSRKPTDTPPGRLIEHQPQYRGRRTIYRDEILRLLKTSLTNREIAQRTGATYQTVTHWRRWAADRP